MRPVGGGVDPAPGARGTEPAGAPEGRGERGTGDNRVIR